jgi:hypothetical protein
MWEQSDRRVLFYSEPIGCARTQSENLGNLKESFA